MKILKYLLEKLGHVFKFYNPVVQGLPLDISGFMTSRSSEYSKLVQQLDEVEMTKIFLINILKDPEIEYDPTGRPPFILRNTRGLKLTKNYRLKLIEIFYDILRDIDKNYGKLLKVDQKHTNVIPPGFNFSAKFNAIVNNVKIMISCPCPLDPSLTVFEESAGRVFDRYMEEIDIYSPEFYLLKSHSIKVDKNDSLYNYLSELSQMDELMGNLGNNVKFQFEDNGNESEVELSLSTNYCNLVKLSLVLEKMGYKGDYIEKLRSGLA